MPQTYGLGQLNEAYPARHRALGRPETTTGHHEDTFASFEHFRSDTRRPADATGLTTEAMQAFAGWPRERPTRGWRGRHRRSVHATHGALKDLRAFVR